MAVYRAASPDALRMMSLDTLTLAYHRPAGATHMLAEPAPEIIAALQEGATDMTGLSARLAARFDLASASGAAIQERLDELVAAGLVEQT